MLDDISPIAAIDTGIIMQEHGDIRTFMVRQRQTTYGPSNAAALRDAEQRVSITTNELNSLLGEARTREQW